MNMRTWIKHLDLLNVWFKFSYSSGKLYFDDEDEFGTCYPIVSKSTQAGLIWPIKEDRPQNRLCIDAFWDLQSLLHHFTTVVLVVKWCSRLWRSQKASIHRRFWGRISPRSHSETPTPVSDTQQPLDHQTWSMQLLDCMDHIWWSKCVPTPSPWLGGGTWTSRNPT